MKTLFVTVGSTQFDDLIGLVSTNKFIKAIVDKGYRKLIVQYGRSDFVQPSTEYNMQIESFDYRDTVEECIKISDLVIGHAGTGTFIDVLSLDKPFISVVNETLDANHQIEISTEMEVLGYSLSTTCEKLIDLLTSNRDEVYIKKRRTYYSPVPHKLYRLLDTMMGFETRS